MKAKSKLLARKDWLSIRQLANEWSAELSTSVDELARALLEAALSGEFDALPSGHGLCTVDMDTRKVWSTTAPLILKQCGEVSVYDFVQIAYARDQIALHQDAIRAFAENRELALPAWLASSVSSGSAQTRYSKTKLEEWYKVRVDKWPTSKRHPSTEDDLAAAKREVSPKIPRDAIRDLRKAFAPPEWTAHGRRRPVNPPA